MQKYLKNNNKGFTLVEVIVVAVIVLILAAVAIPLYNGYVRDSRGNTASNIAGSIASAMGACIQSDNCTESTAQNNFNTRLSTTVGGPVVISTGNQMEIPRGYSGAISATTVHVCGTGSGCTTGPSGICCSESIVFSVP